MERPRLQKFSPEWNGACSGFAYNFSRQNLWRCFPDYDLEDLVGEAQIKFCECRNRYPNVEEPKHFFALFKISFIRRINTIASNRRKKIGIPFSVLKHDDAAEANQERQMVNRGRRLKAGEPVSEDDCLAEAEMELMKETAPEHIKGLIQNLVDAEVHARPLSIAKPTIFKRLAEYYGVSVGTIREMETPNEFLCRLAGRDPSNTNMLETVLTWLAGIGTKTEYELMVQEMRELLT
jgi:hypothetical protein